MESIKMETNGGQIICGSLACLREEPNKPSEQDRDESECREKGETCQGDPVPQGYPGRGLTFGGGTSDLSNGEDAKQKR